MAEEVEFKEISSTREFVGESQALYGVAPVVKPYPANAKLYGVEPYTPVQALYGVEPIKKMDISMTSEQIDENIRLLNKATANIRTTWNSIKNKAINNIQNSWAAQECEKYVQKITDMDGTVEKSIQALDLLSNTYKKAQDQMAQTQEAVKNAINTID